MSVETWLCPRCNKHKPRDQWSNRNGRRASHCKACSASYAAEWRVANKERFKERNREAGVRRRAGLPTLTAATVEWACGGCGGVKPADAFYWSNGVRHVPCKACKKEQRFANRDAYLARQREYQQGRRSEDPVAYRHSMRKSMLWSYYKLTVEDYDSLLDLQGGVCGGCGDPPAENKMLAVDHDHRCCPTKKSCGLCIRGLLCPQCNMAAGVVERFPSIVAWVDRRVRTFVPERVRPRRSSRVGLAS